MAPAKPKSNFLHQGLIKAALLAVLIGSLMAPPAGWTQNDPVTDFKELIQSASNQDWGAFWDGCEESTQQALGRIFLVIFTFSLDDDQKERDRLDKEIGPLPENLGETVFTRDMFVKMMTLMWESADEGEKPAEMFPMGEIEIKELQKDRAVLILKGREKDEEVIMVLRDGKWKYFIDQSQANK